MRLDRRRTTRQYRTAAHCNPYGLWNAFAEPVSVTDEDTDTDTVTVGLTELIAELQSDDMDGRTGAGTGEVCDTGIDRIGRHDVYCRRPNG